MNDKVAVVSDLHGHDQALRQAVNFYDGIHVLANGDIVDGPPYSSPKETIHILADIGATLVRANHEGVLLGALTDTDRGRRAGWQEQWLSPTKTQRYESNTLRSYGLERMPSWDDTAEALKAKLKELGHLAILEEALPYYETDEMLVVHAGLAHWNTWQVQRRELEAAGALMDARQFLEEPPFMGSFDYAKEWRTPYDLGKPLITGHAHRKASAEARTYSTHGRLRRIQLASHLSVGQPLFVYESWTQQIRVFEQ